MTCVEMYLYQRIRDFLYPERVYITEDVRKLNQANVGQIASFR